MKNLKYYPFERNRYFYGKLLSVNDFELEQKYVNDKRRMTNRFLYGSGVVAGMQVVTVDDATISVETGLALDYVGREIVVDVPVTKKLSMIQGLDSYQESQSDYGYLYLCIEYEEKEKEVVHNIAGSSGYATDAEEYNKYKESFRLFLTGNEPEEGLSTATSLYEDTKIIYWGNGIRIKQTMPKFVRSGRTFDLKLEIENMGQQQSFAFSYDLHLTCLKYKGQPRLKISFDERLFEKSGRYEVAYSLEALAVSDTEGKAVIDSGSFHMSISKREVKGLAQGTVITNIVKNNIKNALMDQYYKTSMEEIINHNCQQSIYLAKINLIKAGTSYVIHQVENLPFKQYVLNNALDLAVNQMLIQDVEELKKGRDLLSTEAVSTNKETLSSDENAGVKMSTGEVKMEIEEYAKKGQRFFTEEITHGLGLGRVRIMLGLLDKSNQAVHGSCEIFTDMEPLAELAARTDEQKGTFVIGARLLASTNQKHINIHWTALVNTSDYMTDKLGKKIFIKPSVLNLAVRETYYLEAICSNMNDKRLKWTVKDQGGFIDKNGMYTAPNQAGVYEVVAESIAYADVKASIFVVVREY